MSDRYSRKRRRREEEKFLAREPDHQHAQVLAERHKAKQGAFRYAVWQRYGRKCALCRATDDLQIDHILPVSRGGRSSLHNVQILCGACNADKGDAVVEVGVAE
jgi:5-methylcytosine-specific restriction endonuclease McrA